MDLGANGRITFGGSGATERYIQCDSVWHRRRDTPDQDLTRRKPSQFAGIARVAAMPNVFIMENGPENVAL